MCVLGLQLLHDQMNKTMWQDEVEVMCELQKVDENMQEVATCDGNRPVSTCHTIALA